MTEFEEMSFDDQCFLCQMLIHFSDHGTLPLLDAIDLIEWGYLNWKRVTILPMKDSISVFELSEAGKAIEAKVRKLWKEHYVPAFELETYKIKDHYLRSDAHEVAWAFSRARLELERTSGGFTRAIERMLPHKVHSGLSHG